ncbi:TIGR03086 family metal-binding protein [Streptomyces sp. NPDC051561]|uniref:TIGR03086 family metal-binding protein n=1 Tax=Streptomyces sp. NPDC051561 TaxID=3365658 RepID=UPI003791FCAA
MIDLKPACRRMNDVLAGVRQEQLADPTPCDRYSVGDLIDHVAVLSAAFTGVARRDAAIEPLPAGGPSSANLPGDWRTSLAKSVQGLGDAWDDPAAWEGAADAGVGFELPRAEWGRIALTEVVVHGWDLAQATGRPFELPEQTLRDCFDHVATFIGQAPIEGLWGPSVAVAPDAPLLHRVLGATGRRP